MSDGNFNRALLPKNELSAGLRAGKAQMRTKAEKAAKKIIDDYFSDAPEDKRQAALDAFMKALRT